MPDPSVVLNRNQDPAADVRPDIIVITVDDLGYLPDERVLERLPTINALFLDGGLRFANAYGETPLCSPGRASFLTGQHTRRHGVVRNDPRLFDPSHTVATMLRRAGYATGMFCTKYLNRADLLTDHKPPGWDRVVMGSGNTLSDSDWWMDDRAVHRSLPATSVIGIQAAKWMRIAPGPSFAWIAPGQPHAASGTYLPDVLATDQGDPRCADIASFEPPSYDFDIFPGGWPLTKVCESLLQVDRMVARVQAAEEARGRPIVWIFTSDNGMSWGQHGFPQKNDPWATQLPLYVAGTGITPGTTEALVSNIDLLPTIAASAGANPWFADGVSFADVLAGTGTGRDHMLEDHPHGGAAAISGRTVPPWSAVRSREWRLLTWERGQPQLFHLVADPWELHDIAGDHPDVVAELQAGLETLGP